MQEVYFVKHEIVTAARANGGRYLLLRRYRPDPFAPKSPLDIAYDACESLVDERKARWLPSGSSHESGPGPGIELTAFEDDPA